VGSLELIDELVAKLSPTKFLFVGGFRSDEVLPDDYLMEQLVKRPKDPPVVISIGGLQMSNVATFLADTLKKEQEIVTPLAELIYEETDGNMFFVKQYIGYLYHNGHIYSSLQNFGWEWEDLATIQDACTVEDGDVEAVVSKKILRMVSWLFKAHDAVLAHECVVVLLTFRLLSSFAASYDCHCLKVGFLHWRSV
jgi:predicted ATPase